MVVSYELTALPTSKYNGQLVKQILSATLEMFPVKQLSFVHLIARGDEAPMSSAQKDVTRYCSPADDPVVCGDKKIKQVWPFTTSSAILLLFTFSHCLARLLNPLPKYLPAQDNCCPSSRRSPRMQEWCPSLCRLPGATDDAREGATSSTRSQL